jgi:hypothetical protein
MPCIYVDSNFLIVFTFTVNISGSHVDCKNLGRLRGWGNWTRVSLGSFSFLTRCFTSLHDLSFYASCICETSKIPYLSVLIFLKISFPLGNLILFIYDFLVFIVCLRSLCITLLFISAKKVRSIPQYLASSVTLPIPPSLIKQQTLGFTIFIYLAIVSIVILRNSHSVVANSNGQRTTNSHIILQVFGSLKYKNP